MVKNRYIELATMVEAMISAGDLPLGTKLPTHRSFAEKHGIALSIVTRIYNEEPIIARLSEKGIAVSFLALFSVVDTASQALCIVFGDISEQGMRFSLECIRSESTSVSWHDAKSITGSPNTIPETMRNES